MLLVLAASFPLSWLAVKMQNARRQREAVAAIKAAGGWVVYDFEDGVPEGWLEEPKGPAWLRALLGVDFFADVERARIEDDAGMRHISALPRVRFLHLQKSSVTDAGLANLNGATQLIDLWLSDTQISDAGLEHIKDLTQLTDLRLENTNITDAGLKCLTKLNQLEFLWLAGTHISDAGLEHIEGLVRLEFLDLDRTHITDEGLKHLERLSCLRNLRFGADITGAGLESLKALHQLERLTLRSYHVGDTDLDRLRGLNRLRFLALVPGPQFSERGLRNLQQTLPACQVYACIPPNGGKDLAPQPPSSPMVPCPPPLDDRADGAGLMRLELVPAEHTEGEETTSGR
jgi:hypothetical protein